MEWILAHRGDLIIIGILAAVTVTILTNLFRKRKNPCSGCCGSCEGCPGK